MDNTRRAVYNDIYGIDLFKRRIPGIQRNDLHRRRNLFQPVNRRFSKRSRSFKKEIIVSIGLILRHELSVIRDA